MFRHKTFIELRFLAVPYKLYGTNKNPKLKVDGCLVINVLYNSISVISGQWADDTGRLCTMETHLQLRTFHLKGGSSS